jgi:hypothetical protein
MVLKKKNEQALWQQHVGTGWLIVKTAENMVMSVEVFLRPRDGVLCRIKDGKPVLPVELTYEED